MLSYARGIAFALFASTFGGYLFLIVGVHYLAMVYWMYWQQANVLIHSSKDYDAKSRGASSATVVTSPACDLETITRTLSVFLLLLCGSTAFVREREES